jgi:hypothetical protein
MKDRIRTRKNQGLVSGGSYETYGARFQGARYLIQSGVVLYKVEGKELCI